VGNGNLRNITILVVDDQDGIRKLLYEVLQGEGFGVRLAANGKEALSAVEKYNPDVILIDMKMPGMSGIDVLRELKKNKDYKGEYVLMTAYGELEIVNEASKLGVKYQINKPFDIDELLDLIYKICFGNNTGGDETHNEANQLV